MSQPISPTAPSTLTPVQAQVAFALAQGTNISTAAAAAGVHRNTIHRWLNTREFKTAIQQAQSDALAALRIERHDRIALALSAIRSLLSDAQTPPDVRLRAAMALLGQTNLSA